MTIRELTPTDAALFRSLRLQALETDPDAFGVTLEDATALADDDWEAFLRKEIVPARKAILIADEDGVPFGTCLVGLRDDDPRAGYFGGLYVSPPFRGHGHGRSLLEAVEAWIRRQGGVRVKTGVAAPNGIAVGFYKAQGYAIGKEVGKLRPGSNIPVYGIEKQLTPDDG